MALNLFQKKSRPSFTTAGSCLSRRFTGESPKAPSFFCPFADDFTVFASAVDIEEAETQLSHDLDLIHNWASTQDLDIAPSKSTFTLFSHSTHEHRYHPLYQQQLPSLGQHPKILGIPFDPPLYFLPSLEGDC